MGEKILINPKKKSVLEDISAIVFTVAWNTHDVQ